MAGSLGEWKVSSNSDADSEGEVDGARGSDVSNGAGRESAVDESQRLEWEAMVGLQERQKQKHRKRTRRERDGESEGDDERSVNWKPEPFPEAIPTTEKKRRWREWKAQFLAVMELRGEKQQKRKALLLFACVGAEVQRVIQQEKMMEPPKEGEGGKPFFEVMLQRLDRHFDKFSDGSVEVRLFNDMKQSPTETAHEFHQRLLEQADICGFSEVEQLVRVRLIDGLRDKVVTEHAHMANLPSSEIVGMASRNEARRAAIAEPPRTQGRTESFRDDEIAAIAAAIRSKLPEKSGQYSERYRPYGSEDRQSRGRARQGSSFKPRERPFERPRGRPQRGFTNKRPGKSPDGVVKKEEAKEKPRRGQECERCLGRYTHRDGVCPAKTMECFKCGVNGHLAAACKEPEGANMVESDKDGKDEVEEWLR